MAQITGKINQKCTAYGDKLAVAKLKAEHLTLCISFKWPHIIIIEACKLQFLKDTYISFVVIKALPNCT